MIIDICIQVVFDIDKINQYNSPKQKKETTILKNVEKKSI